jgi:hypothetical protein
MEAKIVSIISTPNPRVRSGTIIIITLKPISEPKNQAKVLRQKGK